MAWGVEVSPRMAISPDAQPSSKLDIGPAGRGGLQQLLLFLLIFYKPL